MRLRVDQQADALYLVVDDSSVSESEEVCPGVIVDFNEQNEIVGVEILHLSKRSRPLNLRELVFETT